MIKKVALINDISGFGKCSLVASISILSVLGVQSCPMPTAVLTNQSGYKNHYCVDLTNELNHFEEMWSLNNESFDGIYSGYVANKNQIDIITQFISKFRKSNTMVLVDPIMADNGVMYSAYNNATCQKVVELSKTADIITPNLSELCIIADKDYHEITKNSENPKYLEIISELATKAIAHDNQKIVVTGINKGDKLFNGVFTKGSSFFTSAKRYGDSFSGTGDIFASIVCGMVTNGIELNYAVSTATKFIETVIADTIKEPYNRNDGVNFEKFLYLLCTKKEENP